MSHSSLRKRPFGYYVQQLVLREIPSLAGTSHTCITTLLHYSLALKLAALATKQEGLMQ